MNAEALSSRQVWAVFAALTAIFAKVGVEDIKSDLATFIRTVTDLRSGADQTATNNATPTTINPIPESSRPESGCLNE
jgi:hypothetical protein